MGSHALRAQAASWAGLIWRYWPLAAGLLALSAIAAARLSEPLLGLSPCFLCYVQRWFYWAAAGVALLSAPLWLPRPDNTAARLADAVMALVFLGGAGVAFYHAGVEWGWFTGPNVCTSEEGVRVRAGDLSGLDAPMRVVSCELAALRVAGLSMAGWNMLLALSLAGLSGLSALRGRLAIPLFSPMQERSHG